MHPQDLDAAGEPPKAPEAEALDEPRIILPRILTSAQEKVLAILARARGPMNRTAIAEEINRHGIIYTHPNVHVGEAIGASDATKRAGQEKRTKRSMLLSLGYVEERMYDIEGIKELGVRITPLGRQVIIAIEARRKANGKPSILLEQPESQDDDSMADAPPARAIGRVS